MKKTIMLCFLITMGYYIHAQSLPPGTKHKFSNEEMSDFLLHKSKQQRTKGWISLVGGPALTFTGMVLSANKQNNTRYDLGYIVGGTGLIMTITSVPLLLSANKNKRKAQLMLKQENTSFYWPNRQTTIGTFGVSIPI